MRYNIVKENFTYIQEHHAPLCKIGTKTMTYSDGYIEAQRTLSLGFGLSECTDDNIYTLSSLTLTYDYIQASIVKNNCDVIDVVFKVSNYTEISISNIGVNNTSLRYSDMQDKLLYTVWRNQKDNHNEYILTAISLLTLHTTNSAETKYQIAYTLRCVNGNLVYQDNEVFLKLKFDGLWEYFGQENKVRVWDEENNKTKTLYENFSSKNKP